MTRVDLGPLSLNVEIAGNGPPVVLLHGFTGSAAGWGVVIDALSPEYTTVAIDIVGHGRSDSPPTAESYEMRRAVDDLVAVVAKAGHQRATWLGYSMGGRTALQVASFRPEAVNALILEGASPGLPTVDERLARIAADEVLAQRWSARAWSPSSTSGSRSRCSPRRPRCRRRSGIVSAPVDCGTRRWVWRTRYVAWEPVRRPRCMIG